MEMEMEMEMEMGMQSRAEQDMMSRRWTSNPKLCLMIYVDRCTSQSHYNIIKKQKGLRSFQSQINSTS